MNTNTVNDLIIYLKEIEDQLKKYNSINNNDLKTICLIQAHSLYNSLKINQQLQHIFILINDDTNIYNTNSNLITDLNFIYNNFINNNLKIIYPIQEKL